MTARQDQDTREERNEMVAAKNLRTGDMIDLYADPYADPNSDPGQVLECELALVSTVKAEMGSRYRGSVDCVTVYTDAVNFTCPPDHMIRLCGRMPGTEVF